MQPSLDLRVRNAAFFHPATINPFTSVNLDARYNDGRLELGNLQAEWAAAKISGNGALPVSLFSENLPLAGAEAQGPATFQLQVQGLVVDAISALPREVGGTVGFTVQLEAPRVTGDCRRLDRQAVALKGSRNRVAARRQAGV
jgi:hypothetical protein